MHRIFILFILAIIPSLVNAESYLCVAVHVTGFRVTPNTQRWEQTTLPNSSEYIVTPSFGTVIKKGNKYPWSYCPHGFDKNAELRCQTAETDFLLNKKTLRFMAIYKNGYWNQSTEPAATDHEDDTETPFLSIGTCSLREP